MRLTFCPMAREGPISRRRARGVSHTERRVLVPPHDLGFPDHHDTR
jgi:hypothetical protein